MKRKLRADSWWADLPKAVRQETADLLDQKSQAFVRAWLLEKHDKKVSNTDCTAFYQWFHSERQLEQLASESSRFRETLLAMQQAGELQLSDDSISTLGQAFFEHQAVREEDPKVYAIIKSRRQRDRELAIKERSMADRERRTALLEAKAAQADKAKAIAEDKTLTEEQRTQRMREVFLL